MSEEAARVPAELVTADLAAVERAFAQADGTLELRLLNQRVAPVPMEGRAVAAQWDAGPGKLTLWSSTQVPHQVKQLVAECVGIPEIHVRVIAPEVGGGFGCKIPVYPEECLLPWVSRALRRPVKWTGDRSESFLSDLHGRDHQSRAEMAIDQDGRFLALRIAITANQNAACTM